MVSRALPAPAHGGMPLRAPDQAAHERAAVVYPPGPLPAGARVLGPQVARDQGVQATEEASAQRAIRHLLKAPGTAYVVTVRGDVYTIYGRSGAVHFRRLAMPDGTVAMQIVSMQGQNPIPSEDPRLLRTFAEEVANTGHPLTPPENDKTSYPDFLRTVAQLFDSPRAPDLAYIPWPGGDAHTENPDQPGGAHGSPNITQARTPLIMAGPGVAPGTQVDTVARLTDVAPTIAQFLGVQPVVGRTESGAQRLQFLKWQDGDSLAPSVADQRYGRAPYGSAERAVVFTIDGLSHTALLDAVEKGMAPNIAKLMQRGTTFQNGALAEYPTVTFPNHNTIVTGTGPGHHQLVNNRFYNRDTGVWTELLEGFPSILFPNKHMSPDVETLYEAVTRTFGANTRTAAINQPSTRGASISTLDVKFFTFLVSNLFTFAKHYLEERGAEHHPHGVYDDGHKEKNVIDELGIALAATLSGKKDPPKLQVIELAAVDHLGHMSGPHNPHTRAQITQVDRQIGRVLAELDKNGHLASTLVTITADHGMEHQDSKRSLGWGEALQKAIQSSCNITTEGLGTIIFGNAIPL